MNVCIEEEMGSDNRRTVEGSEVERVVVEDREIFRGLGAAIALLAFRGTRSISIGEPVSRQNEQDNRDQDGLVFVSGVYLVVFVRVNCNFAPVLYVSFAAESGGNPATNWHSRESRNHDERR